MEETRAIDIENKVLGAIENAIKAAQIEGSSSALWTLRIMEALTKLGQSFDYVVNGARPRTDWNSREWTWDMAWAEGRNGKFVDVALALESEWDPDEGEIFWDFEKLIVSRACVRVMIFETPDKSGQNLFTKMIDTINRYLGTQPGDRYLLACWCYGARPPVLDTKHYVVQ